MVAPAGQALVWKEVNYGAMSEKEKQLIVSEVRADKTPWEPSRESR